MYPETQFLEFVLKNILSKPDDISIDRITDDRGVLLTLKVDDGDMPILIGKNGQTARSLRTLLRVIGSKTKQSINLKIFDPRAQDSDNPSDSENSLDDLDI